MAAVRASILKKPGTPRKPRRHVEFADASMPAKRSLTAAESDEPERRRSTRQKTRTVPPDALPSQITAQKASQPRSETPNRIILVSKPTRSTKSTKPTTTPAPRSRAPHSTGETTAPPRIRIVSRAASEAIVIADSASDTADELVGEVQTQGEAPTPRRPARTKTPKPTKSTPKPPIDTQADTDTESEPLSRPKPAETTPKPATAKLVRVSLRADASFLRPAGWPTNKAMPENQNRQSPKDIEAAEGWDLSPTARSAHDLAWAWDMALAIKNLQNTIAKAAKDALQAFERPDRTVECELIGVEIKAGHYTGRGEIAEYQVTAEISSRFPLGEFDQDELMDLMLNTKKDRYIRVSNKYRIQIKEQKIERHGVPTPTTSQAPATLVGTPATVAGAGTPCPTRGLDAIIDRARQLSQANTPAAAASISRESARPFAPATTPAPGTAARKGSATNTMLEELRAREESPGQKVRRALAMKYNCTDPKCLNPRKSMQFTFCYIDSRSKKHIAIPLPDLDKWKTSILRSDATLTNPPAHLFRSWLTAQEQEESKLASGPGGDGRSRYSTARSGGNNTQNVNINIGGQLGSSNLLAQLQNSAAQYIPGSGTDFDLPALPPPPPRTAYSRAPFVIPDRSSSPPPIADSIATKKLLDFLDVFHQRHLGRDAQSSSAITKLLYAVRGAGFNFSDLFNLRDDFFIKKGLKAMWIPILKVEAKEYAKELARLGGEVDDSHNAINRPPEINPETQQTIHPQDISISSIEEDLNQDIRPPSLTPNSLLDESFTRKPPPESQWASTGLTNTTEPASQAGLLNDFEDSQRRRLATTASWHSGVGGDAYTDEEDLAWRRGDTTAGEEDTEDGE